uniref:Sema domain-containing protein n=1 Tax=Macrostomum lignano TaxID=282301 RepID=A0A1I8IRW6_9PLAT
MTDCSNNHVFELLISKEKLLVCGTVDGRFNCSLRQVMQPDHSLDSFGVQLGNTDNRLAKAMTMEDRNVYIGAYLTSGTDPALYRSSLSTDEPAVRTSNEVQQSRTLKPIYQPAKFISVHIIGDYAYYFFQENFEEMSTCGAKSQRIISRVARMCKSDPGYGFYWLSFSKSRLICAQGGNWVRPDGPGDEESSAFYYDLLQDTYVTDTHIYGLFTAAKSGIKASAICGFPISTFNKVFGDQTVRIKHWDYRKGDVPYAYFTDARDRYNRSDCSNLRLRQDEIATYTSNNRFYFLKSARVIQDTNEPLAAGRENWRRLLVTRVPSSQPDFQHTVAFVVTESDSIKKIILSAGSRCVLEEMQLDKSLDGRINDIQLTQTGEHLIVSTSSRVLRLPTSRCGRHALRTSCLAARDPHCGWNRAAFACTVRPANTDQWEQDISPQHGRVCPDRSVPIDGGWSDWRPWQRCQPPRGSGGGSGSVCQCRLRLCDNPAPNNGGRQCGKFHDLLSEVQTANCSVDGGWSAWDAWSSCPTCRASRGRPDTRERTRTCSQPRPAHGGAPCEGPPGQTEVCDVPDCKDVHLPVNGTWSPWSEWSSCSRLCGGGQSKRVRFCREPVNGGLPCVGDSKEWRDCNTAPCLAVQKVQQTGWIRTADRSSATDQPVWQQMVADCRAYAAESGEYRVKLSLSNRTQVCDSAAHRQQRQRQRELGRAWSSWTACSSSCGSGFRQRHRECDNPPPSGSGSYCSGGEAKQIETEWGAWGCWSDCQNPGTGGGAGCGTGKQVRLRTCQCACATELPGGTVRRAAPRTAPRRRAPKSETSQGSPQTLLNRPQCSRWPSWNQLACRALAGCTPDLQPRLPLARFQCLHAVLQDTSGPLQPVYSPGDLAKRSSLEPAAAAAADTAARFLRRTQAAAAAEQQHAWLQLPDLTQAGLAAHTYQSAQAPDSLKPKVDVGLRRRPAFDTIMREEVRQVADGAGSPPFVGAALHHQRLHFWGHLGEEKRGIILGLASRSPHLVDGGCRLSGHRLQSERKFSARTRSRYVDKSGCNEAVSTAVVEPLPQSQQSARIAP